ncbi:hypothetical protein P280DRAFT_468781 [Massarina eburnea CBS 473.64]|uniref:Uncharacterized protein n=1 Tax=Massarina eburnea CBS 473.64 TaxID=1395130 RepID=A0A6A6RZW3_9PLEO|nr:hypothetical protein P280DRAFT_468781 [Massarina eburnea CBS 473.64]
MTTLQYHHLQYRWGGTAYYVCLLGAGAALHLAPHSTCAVREGPGKVRHTSRSKESEGWDLWVGR